MTSDKYSGMNRNSGLNIDDIDHIRQSISDILATPQGTRVMRRDYGSLLSTLIDQPQNPALRIKMMAAVYGAVMRWEPRVTLAVEISPGRCRGWKFLGIINNKIAGVLPLFGKRHFAGSDYIRIPDVPGGLIVQWMTGPVSASENIAYPELAFPTAFPVTCLMAFAATQGNDTIQADVMFQTSPRWKTGRRLNCRNCRNGF